MNETAQPQNAQGAQESGGSSDALEFWEVPSRFQNMGYSEYDCDLVLQGANDDVSDWNKIQLHQ